MKYIIPILAAAALCLMPAAGTAKTSRPTAPPPASAPPAFCSVCSSVGFNTTNVLYTGTSGQGANNVYDVEVGDFNNDGNPDWVAATPFGSSPGRLWVHLGNGAGGFTAPSSFFNVGSNPAAIHAGFLDGDSNQDLVVAGSSSNAVSVLRGVGNGTFQPEVRFNTGGTNPRSVELADMDADGDLDVVVANRSSSNVAILAGDGAGNLGTANVVISGLTSAPRHVVAHDFDNDSREDLAVVLSGGIVTIYLQDSTGGFVNSWAYLPAFDTNHAVASDLDRDNNPDLVSADGFNTVSVATGLGNGIFNTAAPFSAPWPYPDDVAVDDFDGDCDLDVAVAHSYTTPAVRLSVLLGDGAGNLGAATPYDLGPLSNLTTSIRTADFNQDGRPDVIVGNLWSYASVAINNCPCNPPTGSPNRLVVTDAEFPLAVNGVYNLSGTLNGKPRYTSGLNTLWWTNANYWNLHDDDEQRFTHSSNTAYPPASGWLKMPQNSASAMKVLACP